MGESYKGILFLLKHIVFIEQKLLQKHRRKRRNLFERTETFESVKISKETDTREIPEKPIASFEEKNNELQDGGELYRT